MIGRRYNENQRDRHQGKRQRVDGRRDASPGRSREQDAVGAMRSPLVDRTFRQPSCNNRAPRNDKYKTGRKLRLDNEPGHRNSERRDRENRGSRNQDRSSRHDGGFFIDRRGLSRVENNNNRPSPPPEITSVAEFPSLSDSRSNTHTQRSRRAEPARPSTHQTNSASNTDQDKRSSKRSRQSTESSDSSWGDIVLEEEERTSRVQAEFQKLQSRFMAVQASGKDNSRFDEKFECDIEVLVRRQKQLDYGKRTAEYDNYRRTVSRNERCPEHPRTPNKFLRFSRRKWDTKVRLWRRLLHIYDPPGNNSVDDGVSVSSEISCDLEPSPRLSQEYFRPGSSQSSDLQITESLGRLSVSPPPVKPHGDGTYEEFINLDEGVELEIDIQ